MSVQNLRHLMDQTAQEYLEAVVPDDQHVNFDIYLATMDVECEVDEDHVHEQIGYYINLRLDGDKEEGVLPVSFSCFIGKNLLDDGDMDYLCDVLDSAWTKVQAARLLQPVEDQMERVAAESQADEE